MISVQFSSIQLLSRVQLFVTPWIAAHQASLSITNSWSLFKFVRIESVMPSSHLILCHPLLLLPPISPNIRVFFNESTLRMRWPKYSMNLKRSKHMHTSLVWGSKQSSPGKGCRVLEDSTDELLPGMGSSWDWTRFEEPLSPWYTWNVGPNKDSTCTYILFKSQVVVMVK